MPHSPPPLPLLSLLELSLLRVASVVTVIHNNMSVVQEMDRRDGRARDSYVDALEVCHNTCRQFEEREDPGADWTRSNVEWMASACATEG